MKRFFTIILAFAFVLFTVSACARKPETGTADSSPGSGEASTPIEDEPAGEQKEQTGSAPEALEKLLEAGSGWTFWKSPEGERDGIPGSLCDGIPDEELDAWINDRSVGDPVSPLELQTLYRFVHDFGIGKERLQLENEKLNEIRQKSEPDPDRTYRIWTEEEIDLIVGDDFAAYYACFGNPCAILTETSICPPKWLYEHDAQDYAEQGITASLLETRLPEIEETFGEYVDSSFSGEYERAGKEFKEAFFAKLSENLNELKAKG